MQKKLRLWCRGAAASFPGRDAWKPPTARDPLELPGGRGPNDYKNPPLLEEKRRGSAQLLPLVVQRRDPGMKREEKLHRAHFEALFVSPRLLACF